MATDVNVAPNISCEQRKEEEEKTLVPVDMALCKTPPEESIQMKPMLGESHETLESNLKENILNAAFEGSACTTEGDSFLKSSSAVEVSGEEIKSLSEACKVDQIQELAKVVKPEIHFLRNDKADDQTVGIVNAEKGESNVDLSEAAAQGAGNAMHSPDDVASVEGEMSEGKRIASVSTPEKPLCEDVEGDRKNGVNKVELPRDLVASVIEDTISEDNVTAENADTKQEKANQEAIELLCQKDTNEAAKRNGFQDKENLESSPGTEEILIQKNEKPTIPEIPEIVLASITSESQTVEERNVETSEVVAISSNQVVQEKTEENTAPQVDNSHVKQVADDKHLSAEASAGDGNDEASAIACEIKDEVKIQGQAEQIKDVGEAESILLNKEASTENLVESSAEASEVSISDQLAQTLICPDEQGLTPSPQTILNDNEEEKTIEADDIEPTKEKDVAEMDSKIDLSTLDCNADILDDSHLAEGVKANDGNSKDTTTETKTQEAEKHEVTCSAETVEKSILSEADGNHQGPPASFAEEKFSNTSEEERLITEISDKEIIHEDIGVETEKEVSAEQETLMKELDTKAPADPKVDGSEEHIKLIREESQVAEGNLSQDKTEIEELQVAPCKENRVEESLIRGTEGQILEEEKELEVTKQSPVVETTEPKIEEKQTTNASETPLEKYKVCEGEDDADVSKEIKDDSTHAALEVEAKVKKTEDQHEYLHVLAQIKHPDAPRPEPAEDEEGAKCEQEKRPVDETIEEKERLIVQDMAKFSSSTDLLEESSKDNSQVEDHSTEQSKLTISREELHEEEREVAKDDEHGTGKQKTSDVGSTVLETVEPISTGPNSSVSDEPSEDTTEVKKETSLEGIHDEKNSIEALDAISQDEVAETLPACSTIPEGIEVESERVEERSSSMLQPELAESKHKSIATPEMTESDDIAQAADGGNKNDAVCHSTDQKDKELESREIPTVEETSKNNSATQTERDDREGSEANYENAEVVIQDDINSDQRSSAANVTCEVEERSLELHSPEAGNETLSAGENLMNESKIEKDYRAKAASDDASATCSNEACSVDSTPQSDLELAAEVKGKSQNEGKKEECKSAEASTEDEKNKEHDDEEISKGDSNSQSESKEFPGVDEQISEEVTNLKPEEPENTLHSEAEVLSSEVVTEADETRKTDDVPNTEKKEMKDEHLEVEITSEVEGHAKTDISSEKIKDEATKDYHLDSPEEAIIQKYQENKIDEVYDPNNQKDEELESSKIQTVEEGSASDDEKQVNENDTEGSEANSENVKAETQNNVTSDQTSSAENATCEVDEKSLASHSLNTSNETSGDASAICSEEACFLREAPQSKLELAEEISKDDTNSQSESKENLPGDEQNSEGVSTNLKTEEPVEVIASEVQVLSFQMVGEADETRKIEDILNEETTEVKKNDVEVENGIEAKEAASEAEAITKTDISSEKIKDEAAMECHLDSPEEETTQIDEELESRKTPTSEVKIANNSEKEINVSDAKENEANCGSGETVIQDNITPDQSFSEANITCEGEEKSLALHSPEADSETPSTVDNLVDENTMNNDCTAVKTSGEVSETCCEEASFLKEVAQSEFSLVEETKENIQNEAKKEKILSVGVSTNDVSGVVVSDNSLVQNEENKEQVSEGVQKNEKNSQSESKEILPDEPNSEEVIDLKPEEPVKVPESEVEIPSSETVSKADETRRMEDAAETKNEFVEVKKLSEAKEALNEAEATMKTDISNKKIKDEAAKDYEIDSPNEVMIQKGQYQIDAVYDSNNRKDKEIEPSQLQTLAKKSERNSEKKINYEDKEGSEANLNSVKVVIQDKFTSDQTSCTAHTTCEVEEGLDSSETEKQASKEQKNEETSEGNESSQSESKEISQVGEQNSEEGSEFKTGEPEEVLECEGEVFSSQVVLQADETRKMEDILSTETAETKDLEVEKINEAKEALNEEEATKETDISSEKVKDEAAQEYHLDSSKEEMIQKCPENETDMIDDSNNQKELECREIPALEEKNTYKTEKQINEDNREGSEANCESVETVVQDNITYDQTSSATNVAHEVENKPVALHSAKRSNETLSACEDLITESARKKEYGATGTSDDASTTCSNEACFLEEVPGEHLKENSPSEAEKEDFVSVEASRGDVSRVALSETSLVQNKKNKEEVDEEISKYDANSQPESKEILPVDEQNSEEITNIRPEISEKVLGAEPPEMIDDNMKVAKISEAKETLNEAEATTKKDFSTEKIKDEVAEDYHLDSPEETTIKKYPEDESKPTECPGEKTEEAFEGNVNEEEKVPENLDGADANETTDQIVDQEDVLGKISDDSSATEIADGSLKEVEERQHSEALITEQNVPEKAKEPDHAETESKSSIEEVNNPAKMSLELQEEIKRTGTENKEKATTDNVELENQNSSTFPAVDAVDAGESSKEVGGNLVTEVVPTEPIREITNEIIVQERDDHAEKTGNELLPESSKDVETETATDGKEQVTDKQPADELCCGVEETKGLEGLQGKDEDQALLSAEKNDTEPGEADNQSKQLESGQTSSHVKDASKIPNAGDTLHHIRDDDSPSGVKTEEEINLPTVEREIPEVEYPTESKWEQTASLGKDVQAKQPDSVGSSDIEILESDVGNGSESVQDAPEVHGGEEKTIDGCNQMEEKSTPVEPDNMSTKNILQELTEGNLKPSEPTEQEKAKCSQRKDISANATDENAELDEKNISQVNGEDSARCFLAEGEKLKASEVKQEEVECDQEKGTTDEKTEPAASRKIAETSSFCLVQASEKETSKRDGQFTEEIDSTSRREDLEAEAGDYVISKDDEEKQDEEESGKQKSDADTHGLALGPEGTVVDYVEEKKKRDNCKETTETNSVAGDRELQDERSEIHNTVHVKDSPTPEAKEDSVSVPKKESLVETISEGNPETKVLDGETKAESPQQDPAACTVKVEPKTSEPIPEAVLPKSDKHRPAADHDSIAENSICNENIQKFAWEDTAESIPTKEENLKLTEKVPEHGECHDKTKEEAEQSIPDEAAKISLSDLLEKSVKETKQIIGQVIEETEARKTEEAKDEEGKTDEGKDDHEESGEHKRSECGINTPVMVEAKDADEKNGHKKSNHHNILSGVGSKVKHSLSKVKKAITGKSSHVKPPSPKQSQVEKC